MKKKSVATVCVCVTCLDAFQICLLFGEKCAHPLAHIFNIAFGRLLGRFPARQAFLLVRVDLAHQIVRRLVDVLERCLACNVHLLTQRVAMLANSPLG